MKCLLLAPKRYPFVKSMEKGIIDNGIELKTVDYPEFFPPSVNRFKRRFTSLPRKVKNLWDVPYVRKVNRDYLQLCKDFKPDLVFIYNNQQVSPALLEYIRDETKARIVFMLGDSPLYTRTNLDNLHILYFADYIICPDTLWKEQLTRMGVKHIFFDCFGYNDEIYFPKEVTAEELKAYKSDFIYVGSASKVNWGYKRVQFLNEFRDFDLRAYISGEGMDRWVRFFPEVGEKIIPHNRFDSDFNNLVYNCSKIAPVEQVPSLFNGIHVRVFDALGAGIFPLCEYSADLVNVFEGIDLPVIRHYGETKETASFLLKNEAGRKALVQQMRERVETHFTPSMVVARMMRYLFEGKPEEVLEISKKMVSKN